MYVCVCVCVCVFGLCSCLCAHGVHTQSSHTHTPGGQREQVLVLPSGPEDPALHVQAVLFAGKSEFAGQLTQGKFPLPILYVPATHSVHVVILTLLLYTAMVQNHVD